MLFVGLFPTKSTIALETASVVLNYIGRFGSPEVIHTDQGPAFHNELVTELLRPYGIEQFFAQARIMASKIVPIKRYYVTSGHYSLIVSDVNNLYLSLKIKTHILLYLTPITSTQ